MVRGVWGGGLKTAHAPRPQGPCSRGIGWGMWAVWGVWAVWRACCSRLVYQRDRSRGPGLCGHTLRCPSNSRSCKGFAHQTVHGACRMAQGAQHGSPLDDGCCPHAAPMGGAGRRCPLGGGRWWLLPPTVCSRAPAAAVCRLVFGAGCRLGMCRGGGGGIWRDPLPQAKPPTHQPKKFSSGGKMKF